MPPDYSSDNDLQKPLHSKLNGFPSVPPFKSPPSFTSFPNTSRVRHHASLGGPPSTSFRDAHSYPSQSDNFSSHMTSAQSQPHLNAGHAFDTLHQLRGFDFTPTAQPPNGDRKQSYSMVDFGPGPSSAAMLQSHAAKSVGAPLSLHGPHQQQHGFGHHSTSQSAFSGSMHLQSQTPYGPHLQTNGPTSGNGVSNNPIGLNHLNGSGNPSQEEISTIFVVGFPEDMQVRMFCIGLAAPSNMLFLGARIPEHVHVLCGIRGCHAEDSQQGIYGVRKRDRSRSSRIYAARTQWNELSAVLCGSQ